MRRFSHFILGFVSFWIGLGAEGVTRTSDLKIKFVNSNEKAPYFPIDEVSVRPIKVKGEKIKTEVKFEFNDETGSKKSATIILGKRGATIKICSIGKGRKASLSQSEECEKPEEVSPSVRLPKNGPSILRMTIEPPDKDDKENGGVPNLVITRAAAGKLTKDGENDRDYDDFPEDPTLRLRFRQDKGNFIPSRLSRTTHIVEPETGNYLSTSTVTVSKLVVKSGGTLGWSPKSTVSVSDRSYPSSGWTTRPDGSLIQPGADDNPAKLRSEELRSGGGQPDPASAPTQ